MTVLLLGNRILGVCFFKGVSEWVDELLLPLEDGRVLGVEQEDVLFEDGGVVEIVGWGGEVGGDEGQ